MYFLEDITLKEEVLKKAHESWFVVHPESTKMYKDLKRVLLVAKYEEENT